MTDGLDMAAEVLAMEIRRLLQQRRLTAFGDAAMVAEVANRVVALRTLLRPLPESLVCLEEDAFGSDWADAYDERGRPLIENDEGTLNHRIYYAPNLEGRACRRIDNARARRLEQVMLEYRQAGVPFGPPINLHRQERQ